jgi:His-Xaa-Ser system radical SAM maturase HxsC
MVEEIKQTFRGKLQGNLDSVFVGIVEHSENEFRSVRGKYIFGSNEEFEITLTSQDLSKNEPALTNIHDIIHIKKGDIITIDGNRIRSLFRPYSPHNSIFATVRCNSNCLMCSQPPLDFDDTLQYYLTWKYAIQLMPKSVNFIGITGGEPMLMGGYLVDLINDLTEKYPDIRIDILSNGRLQALIKYKKLLSKVRSPSNVIFAVPLYSDYYKDHDHIVQAKDAFYQTILGIHNLSELGFKIEVRIVLHKLSIPRLHKLADFIHFNFPFAHHITFMGLEIIGYTNANKEQLLITDNDNFNNKLKAAINILRVWDYNISIYNLPYCFLHKTLWEYARQSISDWKNSFHPECESCSLKDSCAGFFSWNLKHTSVKPIHNHIA